jgi:hypothetical protein
VPGTAGQQLSAREPSVTVILAFFITTVDLSALTLSRFSFGKPRFDKHISANTGEVTFNVHRPLSSVSSSTSMRRSRALIVFFSSPF